MIGINDVLSDQVIKRDYVVDRYDFQADWPILTREEREDCYSVKRKQMRFDAHSLLESAIESLAEDGYEGMFEHCWDSLRDQHVKDLQKVLDEITEDDCYFVYYEDELIDPDSEMV